MANKNFVIIIFELFSNAFLFFKWRIKIIKKQKRNFS